MSLFRLIGGVCSAIGRTANVRTMSRGLLVNLERVLLPLDHRRLLALEHIHSRSEVEKRVLFVLHMYDKIDANKLNLNSNFQTDLGLDSLDHVDVICAIEEEFETEIPDQHAYELHSPERIIRYLCDKFDLYDDIADLNKDKPDV